MSRPLHIISLGAGVQSTTMALMAAHGEITPMPDAAIFADTQWEPKAVYDHLKWLMSGNVLPFPVHIVTAGNLRQLTLDRSNTTGQSFAAVPWFIKKIKPNGAWEPAMGRRQCTKEFKLEPVQSKCKELGAHRKTPATVWIGISRDEIIRMKPSRVKYIINRHPLIDLGMERRHCIEWMLKRGYPEPPKSSCIACPYHGNAQWRALTPEEFADAVVVDEAIRHQPGMKGEQYVHRDFKPLRDVDLSTEEDRGQGNLFGAECEGMCGV